MAQQFVDGGSAPADVKMLDLLTVMRAINDNLVIIAAALAPGKSPTPTPTQTALGLGS